MNGFKEEIPYCCFHPKEVIVGICALCLKERLLILASKQGQAALPNGRHNNNNNNSKSFRILRRKPINTLNKVFALGSFLHLLEFRHRKPGEDLDDDDDEGSMASLEDSFISMKFEDNGRVLWDSNKKQGTKPINCSSKCNASATKEGEVAKSVVEHSTRQGSLRWQKAIGRLLHVAGWKRSIKAGACHVGLAGKAERRRGWIISLTRRKTTVAAAAAATAS